MYYALGAAGEESPAPQATEWLLDNRHKVGAALAEVRQALPAAFWRRLPRLASDPSVLRAEAVARALLEVSSWELDLRRLEELLDGYQEISPLTIGELWALASLLRLVLLEALVEAAERLAGLAAAPEEPDLETRVVARIVSLRTLEATDWRTVFERTSRVDRELHRDPAGFYRRMDFPSRDLYRKEIEDLARGSAAAEPEVARAVVAAADQAADERARHVGWHLLGVGRRAIERDLGYHPPRRGRFSRLARAFPRTVYLGALALVVLLAAAVAAGLAAAAGGSSGQVAATWLLSLLPASILAVSVVNALITWTVPARVLPRLDFEQDGIPEEHATLVVVPCLLTGSGELESLLRDLEIDFLANGGPHVGFALLSDFADADRQETAKDRRLVERALAGVARLNRRYGATGGGPFFLLHRERTWSATERCWMGWERKRGKLEELGRVLTADGDVDTTFRWTSAPLDELRRFRFVLTLDADTLLPRDAAARLAATLAHPLARPRLEAGRVVEGFAILQPRVEIHPVESHATRFAGIFAGDASFDVYSRAVSDVYQDLFGRAVYAGKGIYDAAAFHAAVSDRVPEGSLLSHDLFESLYARCALVSDVAVFERHPPNVLVYLQRLHRWIRGDWQLLPWLRSRVPRRHGQPGPADLSFFDHWLIVDNLRRSLSAPALLAFFAAGWLLLPGPAWLWTVLAVVTFLMPALLGGARASVGVFGRLTRHAAGGATGTVRRSLGDVRRSLGDVRRGLLALAFLPAEAVLAADAVVRTLFRLRRRRRLLQWTSDALVHLRLGAALGSVRAWRELWLPVVLAVALAGVVAALAPEALPAAAPVLLLWLFSPQLAAWSSRPERRREPRDATPEERQRLRRLARRTWHFYEEIVGPDDHWLPPDNVQQEPAWLIAHRTSPTNVGFLLLSTVAAHQLGYLTTESLAARLSNTFETLARLERHRGHWFNWYDSRELAPLEPRYVSTVDSGNLAAALLAVGRYCRTARRGSLLPPQLVTGALDLVDLLAEAANSAGRASGRAAAAELSHELAGLRTALAGVAGPLDWTRSLSGLRSRLARSDELVEALLAELPEHPHSRLEELPLWSERLSHQLDAIERSLLSFVPWVPRLLGPREGATSAAWGEIEALPEDPRLARLPDVARGAADILRRLAGQEAKAVPAASWRELSELADGAADRAAEVAADLARVAGQTARWLAEMRFESLYDPDRHLFRIGHDVTTDEPDQNHYDLLASEARLASFLAIAKGDVPERHWFHLGRPWVQVDGLPLILSWGGTAFEYLMPRVLLAAPAGTPLELSCRAAVARQVAFARTRGVPWGISESGFHEVDAHGVYQYRAFGVPGTGLRRDLGDRLVVSPYASMLALPFGAARVVKNLRHLEELDMLGRYGLYEAVDFGSGGLHRTLVPKIVRSFMAHHQGMILSALVNWLCDDTLVRLFHSDPRISSTELLLWEQVPRGPRLGELPASELRTETTGRGQAPVTTWATQVKTDQWPYFQLLGNGRYSVLLSDRGAGSSRWHDQALTRWETDPTLELWGTFVYVEDLESRELWSVGMEPVPSGRAASSAAEFRARFAPHQVELIRSHGELTTRMTVTVPPGDDLEIRRVRLTNDGTRHHRFALTSFAEVALAEGAADHRHPAFAKLFVESWFLPERSALLFRRRPRAEDEEPLYLGHALVAEPGVAEGLEWETDRARLLGRGGSCRTPAALVGSADRAAGLSGTTGTTLDPVLALRARLDVPARSEREVVFVTAAGRSRRAVLGLLDRYRSPARITAAFDESRLHTRSELRRVGLGPEEERHVHQLLSALLYPHPALRDPAAMGRNRLDQKSLWPYGISGDHPILLLRARAGQRPDLVRTVLRGHAYWRGRGVRADLVVLEEGAGGYEQPMRDQLHRELTRTGALGWLERPGGIFFLRSSLLPADGRTLLEAVARVVLDTARGSLAHQLDGMRELPSRLPRFEPVASSPPVRQPTTPLERPQDLLFDNGFGGFSPDGREYVLHLEPGRLPPAPWSNVIASPEFGFLVTEAGGGFTWSRNSGENRLTPWRNDPVCDRPGEVLYLRDEETGEIWSATPSPAGAPTAYQVRHGAGYTVFRHRSHGLDQQLEIFAARQEPVKILRLRIANLWPQPRRLTASFFVEWVLGTLRHETFPHVVSELDADTGALLARNPLNPDFGGRVAFVAASLPLHGWTTDRTEFLGRDGDLRRPAGLVAIGPGRTERPGSDPCGLVQVHLDVPAGETVEVCFLLGQEEDRERALGLVRRMRDPAAVEDERRQVEELWDGLLGTLTVATPEPEVDVMVNRWLLYQAVACRLWGRSALYQSSGAFGFRDQLQDSLALLHTAPGLARAQLLEAARHQFDEGDVLHWWHPPDGRGIRSRCSDDLLWLPFVAGRYLEATGDRSILEETVAWRTGAPLEPGENERYDRYPAGGSAPFAEHCRRSLVHGLTAGIHGLPLIGTGDWNDGLNRVGREGRGESVWLGWFAHRVARGFADVLDGSGDAAGAAGLRRTAEELRQAIERHGWDGAWYRRGYYDDGTPLGSEQSEQCQIDLIAQAWAVLSGAGDPERTRQALDSAWRWLVREEDRLALLLTPPFEPNGHDPGYIQGYPPGVRENGGQYSHAAVWAAWAFALTGDGDRAATLMRMILPPYRAATPEAVATYRVEPYAVAADIYGVPPHVGRGGWTWYTGSAAWLHRLIVEAILGIRKMADGLELDPCLPTGWPGYQATVRHGGARYEIRVDNPKGVSCGVESVILDGAELPVSPPPVRLPLVDDGREHQVVLRLGGAERPTHFL